MTVFLILAAWLVLSIQAGLLVARWLHRNSH
jgi:hypothetical protein